GFAPLTPETHVPKHVQLLTGPDPEIEVQIHAEIGMIKQAVGRDPGARGNGPQSNQTPNAVPVRRLSELVRLGGLFVRRRTATFFLGTRQFTRRQHARWPSIRLLAIRLLAIRPLAIRLLAIRRKRARGIVGNEGLREWLLLGRRERRSEQSKHPGRRHELPHLPAPDAPPPGEYCRDEDPARGHSRA